ncbi:hypothetical protein HZC53_03210 [Candidatus Uhrbacteria bacterium]|nr:hypothetical protein [Candidatus Uhrbacteria bacterium]
MSKLNLGLNRHVENIFRALAPDIAAWRIIGTAEGPGHCACGHHVTLGSFVLKRPGDEKEVCIGQSCILQTLPFLQQMTGSDKSEAVENWQEQLLEWRRQRALKAGEERLRAILPTAAAFDLWFAEAKQRLMGYGLPPYFHDRAERRLGELARESIPGQRAERVKLNMAGFRNHAPLLISDAKAKGIELGELPDMPPADDAWMLLRLQAEDLRHCLIAATAWKVLADDERRLVYGILPATAEDLEIWLMLARELDTQLASASDVLTDIQARMEAAQGEALDELSVLQSASKPNLDERISVWLDRARKLLESTPDVASLVALAEQKRQVRESERKQKRAEAEAARQRQLAAAVCRDALLKAAEAGQRRYDLERRIAEVQAFIQNAANDACYRLSFEIARNPKSQVLELEAKSPDQHTIYILARRDIHLVKPGDVCLCDQQRILHDSPQLRVLLVGLRANISANDRLVSSLQARLQVA